MPVVSHTTFGVWTFDVCCGVAYVSKFKILRREVPFSLLFIPAHDSLF